MFHIVEIPLVLIKEQKKNFKRERERERRMLLLRPSVKTNFKAHSSN